MAYFCGVNSTQSPFKIQQQPVNSNRMDSSHNQQQPCRNPRMENINIFAGGLDARPRTERREWTITDSPTVVVTGSPAVIWEDSFSTEVFGMAKHKPRSDRSLAIGLNKSFQNSPTGKQPERNPFMDIHHNQGQQPLSSGIGPCRQFLAEA